MRGQCAWSRVVTGRILGTCPPTGISPESPGGRLGRRKEATAMIPCDTLSRLATLRHQELLAEAADERLGASAARPRGHAATGRAGGDRGRVDRSVLARLAAALAARRAVAVGEGRG
jgi:hypothetical protein